MSDHSITVDHEENPVNSEPCISKVHVGLRSVKPEAYKPVLVSIGPYHKDDPDLQAMQKNKEMYLNLLLKRTSESPPESHKIYVAELKKFDRRARNYYVDLVDYVHPVDSNTDDFAEMMLLDGCFIVEFLRKLDRHVAVQFDKTDPIKRVEWMKGQILSDMMLLENQLPYFVLSEVYNMTKSVGEKPLEEMVTSCFNFLLPRPCRNSNRRKINHLLHLIHVSCRPSPEKTIKNNEDSNTGSAKSQGVEESSDDQTCCPLLPQNSDCCSDKSKEMKIQMGTVVELQEAGVKFGELKEEDDHYVSLFDIAFTYDEWKVPCFKCGVPCFKCSGVMKVPHFNVHDKTEILLRNLIAYEQHFPNVGRKYFTDFASLMNQLINSEEDAKVLRFKGIITNDLSGDDELSKLFNGIGDNVCESREPYYSEVRLNVDKHCKRTWNTWMAYFNHQYFNNPWAGISTFAAAFLLFLTVGQFVVAVLTLRAT